MFLVSIGGKAIDGTGRNQESGRDSMYRDFNATNRAEDGGRKNQINC